MRSAAVAFVLGLCACDVVYGLTGRIDAPIEPDAGAPGDWLSIAAGNGVTCGIREGDRLWCWGSNRFGQAGVGEARSEIATPRQVLASTRWKQVSIGWSHACGIQVDDTVWCWGANADSQLGVVGAPATVREPIQIDGERTYRAVFAGGDHACAIDMEERAWCWGRNDEGQLGVGDDADRDIATLVSVPDTWRALTLGKRHTCGITADGRRMCWGQNSSGELGDESTMARVVPTERAGETERWAQLSAGDLVTCGITDAGALRCWGDNRAGQLGDNTSTAQRDAPYDVATGDADWIDVQVGSRFACARRADRSLWCWGDVGPIVELASNRGPAALDPGAAWEALAVGRTHVCRLASDRGLWCAGDGSSGQRGDGTGAVSSPVVVGGEWREVDAGGTTTCAIDTSGALSCWGDNRLGQIGDGTYARRLLPVPVAPPTTGQRWATIAVGDEHACGAIAGGGVACWGTNVNGSLGTGTPRSATPVALATTFAVTQLEVSDHALALVSMSDLRGWGRNSRAQMTHDAMPVLVTPTQLVASGISGAKGIAAGTNHSCVIAQDDKPRCTGANDHGQLGDGTDTPRSSWTSTDDSLPMIAITSGYLHTCGVEATGTAACWGRNTEGALGDGSTNSARSPRTVAGGHLWSSLATGERHTCGITTGTELSCWGGNDRGQLGDGTLDQRTMPALIVGSGWSSVSAGEAHTCALRGTELTCWGDNGDGQLGTANGWSTAFTLVPLP